MSKPDVERIFQELGIGEQPAQKRAKDIMTETTTTSESAIVSFPGDRPLQIVRGEGITVSEALPSVLVSLDGFLKDFITPDYLLDGILQRRFIYSLTAQTGHGKTALAVLIARLVGSSKPNSALGKHRAEKGRVVYFAGENPDDLRMRVIGDEDLHNDDKAQIWFIPGTFSIVEMRAKIEAEMQQLGGVDLIIIDTSAAYFLGKDELSNTDMGAHARLLRTLTTLPGAPCVLVLCHPIKHVTEPAQLLPRGGGAFLAEVDGNLTLWKHDGVLLDLHHTDKFRGPGFEPISLRLETITTIASWTRRAG
jgi:AAA domain